MENKKMMMSLIGAIGAGAGLFVKIRATHREMAGELRRLNHNQELLKKVITEFGLESDRFENLVEENIDSVQEEICSLYDHIEEIDRIKADKADEDAKEENTETEK